MAAAGWTAHVDRFPDPHTSIISRHSISAHWASSPIANATEPTRILHRRTDRLPFATPRNWESFEPLLRTAGDAGTVHLDVIPDERRPELARASQLTESLRIYVPRIIPNWTGDRSFREFRWDSAQFTCVGGESDRVDVGRRFPVSAHSQRPGALDETGPRCGLAGTDEDTREDAFRCGEALSAVLLECTLAGMATCTLSHLTELWSSRPHRHLDRKRSYAATSDPGRRTPCPWRATSRDTAAATLRRSEDSSRCRPMMTSPDTRESTEPRRQLIPAVPDHAGDEALRLEIST